MSDRITGILLLLLATAFGVEALGFRATFFSDPLGARAFPLAIAGFLIPLSLILTFKPSAGAAWPQVSAWPPLVVVLVTFVVYALLLEPLGFVIATTLVFAVFAWLYRVKARFGLVTGLIFSAVLYAIFVRGLGLYLPVGDLVERWI
jgi:putative tricarboxylic transport membrane protein